MGNNSNGEFQASGAYIFRPTSSYPTDQTVREFKLYSGRFFDEIHQIYNDWISQTIRVYKKGDEADDSSRNSVEFNWQVLLCYGRII